MGEELAGGVGVGGDAADAVGGEQGFPLVGGAGCEDLGQRFGELGVVGVAALGVGEVWVVGELGGGDVAEGLPFGIGWGGEEDPAFGCGVEAVERGEAVEFGVDLAARGFAGVADEIVGVGVGVGGEHVDEDALSDAAAALGVEAEQGRGGDEHAGVGIGVGFVGAH